MTKEQLRSYRKIKNEYRQIEQRIRLLESQHESEDILQPLREFYREKLKRLTEAQLAIELAIDALDYEERKLIRLRYFDGLPWHRVAAAVHYSEPHTRRLHGEILQKLRNL